MINNKEKKIDQHKRILLLPHSCYIITNLINNKVYVGVTYKNIDIRFKQHIKVANSKTIKKQSLNFAIIKYGSSNFKIEKLNDYTNGYEAYESEKIYIKQFQSHNISYGYNETNGGDSGPIILSYTQDLIKNVLTDYINDLSIFKLCKKYNLPRYTIDDICRFRYSLIHNIPNDLIQKTKEKRFLSKKRKKVKLQQVEQIFADFLGGAVMQRIADKYNLSINNVWNILHRNTLKNIIIISAELELKVKEKLNTTRYWRKSKNDI